MIWYITIKGYGSISGATIGGGIVGPFCAFEIARNSNHLVTVYKKNLELGGRVTPHAAGGFRSMYSTPTQIELSLVSNEFWRRSRTSLGLISTFE